MDSRLSKVLWQGRRRHSTYLGTLPSPRIETGWFDSGVKNKDVIRFDRREEKFAPSISSSQRVDSQSTEKALHAYIVIVEREQEGEERKEKKKKKTNNNKRR